MQGYSLAFLVHWKRFGRLGRRAVAALRNEVSVAGRARRVGFRRTIVLLFAAVTIAASCQKKGPVATTPPTEPTVRLYVMSTVAGALEPCGCTKDQLGGIDHAAAFIQAEAPHAPHSLVVGAGPMLFLDPKSEPSRATQDL